MKHLLLGSLVALGISSVSLPAQVNVLTYHNDNSRTGQNTNETALTPANVNTNTFGKIFSHTVDGDVYAQPLYVSGVAIPGQGTHNVVFVATQHDTVYAFDADSTSGPSSGLLWSTNLGISATTNGEFFGTRYNNGQYTDISPEVGITGTPVIDPVAGTIYVDAFTHEGANFFHRIHALNITNGHEQPNSPSVVSASVPGIGVASSGGTLPFNPISLQRAALTLAGGKLYVCYSGFADTDPYHGWLMGFDAVTLQQLTNCIFVTTPNSTTASFGANAGEGGIWMSGGGLCVDANTNLYLEVANGSFNATAGSGGTEYGDSFLKFSTTNGLTLVDYFTPFNQAARAGADADLGSGGCILLPPQSGPATNLLVGSGKMPTTMATSAIFVVNCDQMTSDNLHYNGPSGPDHILQTVLGQTGSSFDTPAYFNGRIYYGASSDKVKAFTVSSGALSSTAVSTGSRTYAFPGTTPSVTANGNNNGIVWDLANTSPAVLVACNAANLTTEIYNSSQKASDQPANGIKYATPTAANGKVHIGGHHAVTTYGLFVGSLAFSSPTYTVSRDGGTATVTVNRTMTAGAAGAVQLSYATADGTAIGGVDYATTNGTLNWASGDATSKSFTVTILQPNAAESNLTVNLALSAPGGGATIGGQSTAVLSILQDSYDTWRFAHFAANAGNSSVAGDLADPDGDGVVNLMEYALASDPNVSDATHWPTAAIAGGDFQLYFPRNNSASNLTYVVETSDLSGTWSPLVTYTSASGWVVNSGGATVAESAPNGVAPDQSVNVTVDAGPPGANSQFFRFRVHR